MTHYYLKKEQIVPRPVSEVFPFFSNPENLAKITPTWLAFEIVSKRPLVMREGLEIDYAIRVLGFPMKWTSKISAYRPPGFFVDEQIRGPYAFWHHTHTFREIPEGTHMLDEVRYGLGFGFLGHLAQALFVKRDLDRIFQFRAQTIREIFNC